MKKIVLKVLGDSRRYFAERISNLIFYLFYCPLVSLYIKLSLYNFNSFDNWEGLENYKLRHEMNHMNLSYIDQGTDTEDSYIRHG